MGSIGGQVKQLTEQQILNAVYDTTTGGLKISGTISGSLTITGDLTVEGNFNFGDASTDIMTIYGYIIGTASGNTSVNIGAGTPDKITPTVNDFYVTGESEVDGDAYFDGNVFVDDEMTAFRWNSKTNTAFDMISNAVDIALTDAFIFRTASTFTQGDILSIRNNASELFIIDKDGDVLVNAGTFDIQSTTAVNAILDEDNMASDSDTALATQQSIKAYVDAVDAFWDRSGTDLSPKNVGDTVTADGGLTIGTGAAGVDYTLTFNGETSDGIQTWLEDESEFDFTAQSLTLDAYTDGTDDDAIIHFRGANGGTVENWIWVLDASGKDISWRYRQGDGAYSTYTPKIVFTEQGGCTLAAGGPLSMNGTLGTVTVFDIADGAVGAPSFRWDDDTDTGIYRVGADETGFTNGGNLRFSVNANGIDINGSQLRNVTTVNAATYDLVVTDDILNVTYTGTAAVTSLTLMTAQTVAGRTIVIKDAGGQAGTNNITIDTEGAETIDGQATYTIVSDYTAVTLYSDGSNWFII